MKNCAFTNTLAVFFLLLLLFACWWEQNCVRVTLRNLSDPPEHNFSMRCSGKSVWENSFRFTESKRIRMHSIFVLLLALKYIGKNSSKLNSIIIIIRRIVDFPINQCSSVHHSFGRWLIEVRIIREFYTILIIDRASIATKIPIHSQYKLVRISGLICHFNTTLDSQLQARPFFFALVFFLVFHVQVFLLGWCCLFKKNKQEKKWTTNQYSINKKEVLRFPLLATQHVNIITRNAYGMWLRCIHLSLARVVSSFISHPNAPAEAIAFTCGNHANQASHTTNNLCIYARAVAGYIDH